MPLKTQADNKVENLIIKLKDKQKELERRQNEKNTKIAQLEKFQQEAATESQSLQSSNGTPKFKEVIFLYEKPVYQAERFSSYSDIHQVALVQIPANIDQLAEDYSKKKKQDWKKGGGGQLNQPNEIATLEAKINYIKEVRPQIWQEVTAEFNQISPEKWDHLEQRINNSVVFNPTVYHSYNSQMTISLVKTEGNLNNINQLEVRKNKEENAIVNN
ncbi:hypothetical protein ['Camptotheca acuminata' phytoplasma]|uniref:hypothetical protein n=1 Tax='Camptotheca acuminata' phytoplasma TaxID=3239192 RepID=UPI00351A5327